MKYLLKILLVILPFTLFTQNSYESVVCGLIDSDQNLSVDEIAVYEFYSEPQIDETINNYLKKNYNISYDQNAADSNEIKIKELLCLDSVCFLTEKEMHLYDVKAEKFNETVVDDFFLTNAIGIIWHESRLTYCEFSLPVYSQDGNYAAIEYSLTRGGMLDYWKVWVIMEKIENEWVMKEAYQFEQS